MKKAILLVVSAIGLLLPQMMPAQGTIYLSNVSQPIGGSAAVASNSWFAGIFRTGTNSGGYGLNSIQLLMDVASGSPRGLNVMLYGANGIVPGNSLGNLIGSDPATGGLYAYLDSSTTLSPNTRYFVVVTAETSVADGSYQWSLANTTTYGSSDGWFLGSGYYHSSDGSSWAFTRPFPLQFAVNATAVPEQATPVVVGLGLVGLSFWRHKSRQGK